MVSSDPNDMSHGMYRGKACQAFWFWLLVPDLILAFSPGWDSRSIRQPFGSSGSGLSLF
jgi:hypothetical protein